MHGNPLNLDPHEVTTLDTYNKIGPKWATTSDGVDRNGTYLWTEEMKMFNGLAASAPLEDGIRQPLLEIGFGTGRDALLFADRYDYVGIEVSTKLLEVARRQTIGKLRSDAFQLMSVYELEMGFDPNTFSLFWACAALLHCSKDRMRDALKSIEFVLKKGAVGFISLKEGDGEKLEYYDELPRYFTYWRHEEFMEELVKAGFNILVSQKKGESGVPFLCYFVQKTG